MTWVGLGLGSNLGDSRALLRAGVAAVRSRHRLLRVSSLFQTEPLGPIEQPDFLNAAILIDTPVEPANLLEELQTIEREAGRDRSAELRYGPRSLDLDILLWAARQIDEPSLTVPHPRLGERRFALEPLIEVWPSAALPDGTRLLDLWPGVSDQVSRKLEGPNWFE